MKSNNSTDENRAPRVPSPSFKFGSRQRPPAASTDEIVRFVREYQRCKAPPTMHNISGMKTRAVLPGIERKSSNNADESKGASLSDKRSRNSFELDSRVSKMGHLNPEVGLKLGASFDDEYTELELEEDEYLYNHTSYRNGKKNHSIDNGMQFGGDSFDGGRNQHHKRTSIIKPDVDLEVEKIFSRSNVSVNNKGFHHRKTHGNKRGSINAQTHTTSESFPSSHPLRQNGAMRPCALRQLPPIGNNDVDTRPARPSAPSPGASPYLQSSSNDDSDYVDDEEVEEIDDQNINKLNVDNDDMDDYSSSEDEDRQVSAFTHRRDKYDSLEMNTANENDPDYDD